MIILLLSVFLSVAVPAAAQSTLQLPDLTLFGEYTLYLAAPAPLVQEIPTAAGMSDSRLSYPRTLFKVDLAEPAPPLFYWQRIPRSLLASPGLLPDSATDEVPQHMGDGQPVASGNWGARGDYIPGSTVRSEFAAIRSVGIWDLSTELHFDLADGWISSPPNSPTNLTIALQSRRRAEGLNIDAAFGAGAFYYAEAVDTPAVYTLGLGAGLYGELGALQWREKTQLFGISGIGGGGPPGSMDVQRGAVQQDIELSYIGSRWNLSLRSGGVLAVGIPSGAVEEHGNMSLELGWRHPNSILLLRAGGAAQYYDDSLAFYPSGGFELYSGNFFSLMVRAAPFVRLPPGRLQTICAVQAVYEESAIPHLQSEGGYSLYSELRFDHGAAFGAALSFEWIKGRIYLVDALNAAVPELDFTDTSQGILEGNLTWQIRPARPGIRLDLGGELAAAFPLPAQPWRNLLSSHAGLVWTTDFNKLPVEFIIKALIGDFADDGSQAFLFTDWEIVSGLITSIEGNWKIGKNGAVHTGFEAFLGNNLNYRFLIGYGIRK